MGEMRQNLATKRWVIIATERAKRPHELAADTLQLTGDLPEWDAHCPFCPGNEEADLEVMTIPAQGPWQTRVVRNRFPAVQPAGKLSPGSFTPETIRPESAINVHALEPDNDHPFPRIFEGIYRQLPAVGYHEVVVESRRHNTCHALEAPTDIARMLDAFQARGRAIEQDAGIEHIIYFKNHGTRAGTSLMHPHTQLIGLPVVPYSIRSRVDEARSHYRVTGRCVMCTMLEGEVRDGRRIIAENDHFVAFIPYAAYSPFHTWIMPRRHESSFLQIGQVEIDALSEILHRVLRQLYNGLHDPSYNYVLRSAPLREDGHAILHWYVTIIPRVNYAAGFELGTGMYINTVLPEDAAAWLRTIDL